MAPKVHFLFGFQDRALEDEFREDLIECSRSRIFMGYGVSIFMILFGPTFQSLMTMDFLLFYSDWRVVLWNVLPVLFALLFLMAGLSFCIYAYMKFSDKRAVLHVTGWLIFWPSSRLAWTSAWVTGSGTPCTECPAGV